MVSSSRRRSRRTSVFADNPDFQKLALGDVLTSVGSRASSIAFALLAFDVTRSPVVVGFVAGTSMFVIAVLGIPAGAIVDRGGNRSFMIWSSLVAAVACFTVGVAVVVGSVSVPLLVAAAAIIAACETLYSPAYGSSVLRVVRDHELGAAYSVEKGRDGVAQLLGPPAGSFLYTLNRAFPFWFDCLSYLAAAFSVSRIKSDLNAARVTEGPVVGAETGRADAWWFGVVFIWRSRILRTLVIAMVVLDFAVNGYVIAVLLALREQSDQIVLVGLSQSTAAVGIVLGAVVAAKVVRRLKLSHAVILGQTTTAVGIALTAVAVQMNIWLVLPSTFVAFLGLPTAGASTVSYVMRAAPYGVEARVRSAITTFSQLAAPLGPIVAGTAIATFGGAEAILFLALVSGVCPLILLTSREVRRAPLPASIA